MEQDRDRRKIKELIFFSVHISVMSIIIFSLFVFPFYITKTLEFRLSIITSFIIEQLFYKYGKKILI